MLTQKQSVRLSALDSEGREQLIESMDMRHKNEIAAQAFADAFDPPLTVAHSERVNNVPTPHVYCAAGMIADGAIGVTAIVFGNGHLKAYIEFVGARDLAEDTGRKFAKLSEIWDAEHITEAG